MEKKKKEKRKTEEGHRKRWGLEEAEAGEVLSFLFIFGFILSEFLYCSCFNFVLFWEFFLIIWVKLKWFDLLIK